MPMPDPFLDLMRQSDAMRAWTEAHLWHMVGGTIGVGAAVGLMARQFSALKAPSSTSWGSARWATAREIRRAGLYAKDGIVLARHGRRLLRSNHAAHVMVWAPSRSGKTLSMIVPTLLSWPGSAIVFDPKGEVYTMTAGYRGGDPHQGGLGQLVGRFDPFAPRGQPHEVRLNLRDFANRGTSSEVRDKRRLNLYLSASDTPPTAITEFWRGHAAELLLSIDLHLDRQPSPMAFPGSIDGMRQFLDTSTAPMLTRLKELSGSPDALVRAGAATLLNMTHERRESVWDSAARLLTLWRDPIVAYHTDATTIPLDGFQFGVRPQTLYIQAKPEDIRGQGKILYRVVWQLLLSHLTDHPIETPVFPTLIVLDEFAALGYMPPMETAFAEGAGYELRLLGALQDLNQLYASYGERTAILNNCPVRVFFAPNDMHSAQQMGLLLGPSTVQERTTRQSASRFALWWQQQQEQVSTHARDLLTPAEVTELSPDDAIIRVTSHKPIRAQKSWYSDDRTFRRRARMSL